MAAYLFVVSVGLAGNVLAVDLIADLAFALVLVVVLPFPPLLAVACSVDLMC